MVCTDTKCLETRGQMQAGWKTEFTGKTILDEQIWNEQRFGSMCARNERMDGQNEGLIDARDLNMRHFGWRENLGENLATSQIAQQMDIWNKYSPASIIDGG